MESDVASITTRCTPRVTGGQIADNRAQTAVGRRSVDEVMSACANWASAAASPSRAAPLTDPHGGGRRRAPAPRLPLRRVHRVPKDHNGSPGCPRPTSGRRVCGPRRPGGAFPDTVVFGGEQF